MLRLLFRKVNFIFHFMNFPRVRLKTEYFLNLKYMEYFDNPKVFFFFFFFYSILLFPYARLSAFYQL